jgi:F0F1-type ATP synthase assembly protein I
MNKHYHQDPSLVQEIAKKTDRIEEAYLAKQTKKRQQKAEKEDLSQKWVAPLLLTITLLLGFLISIIFK